MSSGTQELVTIIPWTFIAQILNLFIQVYLIKRFLFKPINEVLEKRRQQADQEIREAREAKEAADSLKVQYEEGLAGAKAEAAQIVQSAQKEAQIKADETLKQAQEQAAGIRRKAEADIAQEKKKAINEVKDEIGGLAMDIAGKVVEKEINEADHKKRGIMTTATSLYGQSLYDLAAEEGLSEEILKQMDAVNAIFKENPDYITLLLEPSIPRRERLGLLEEAFRDQLHPYLQNFLMILLENNLLRGFGSCCRTFRESYNKDHGIEEATVTSAIEMTDAQVDSLRAKLEQISGKKVILRQKVDGSVLGGLKVEIGGKLLDGTVMGRLADLRKKVSETVL